jgi:hypothetical protein
LLRPHRSREFAEESVSGTSGAKARTEKKDLIAALKRCATQNHSLSAVIMSGLVGRDFYFGGV